MALDWRGKTRWLKKRMEEESAAGIRKVHEKRRSTKKDRLRSKKHKTKTESASNRAKELRINATPHEVRVKNFLMERGIDFKFQKIVYTRSSYYIIDFYFHNHRLCLEIDGSSHHTDEGIIHDKLRDSTLKNMGMRVLHIENDMIDHDFGFFVGELSRIGIL